eukprot:COSAG05_NODE_1294_length_5255_cov_3.346974_6_plen_50_part_00
MALAGILYYLRALDLVFYYRSAASGFEYSSCALIRISISEVTMVHPIHL